MRILMMRPSSEKRVWSCSSVVVKERLPTKMSCFWLVAVVVAVGGGMAVGGGKLGGGMLVLGAHMVVDVDLIG